jgi:lysyl-tRNA synthetase class II
MTIINYKFKEDKGILKVYFTMFENDEEIDRTLNFDFWDIEYYLPNIMSVDDLTNLTDDMVYKLVLQYLKEN